MKSPSPQTTQPHRNSTRTRTTNANLSAWHPDELGLFRAAVISLLILAIFFGGLWCSALHFLSVRKPTAATTYVHIVNASGHRPPPVLIRASAATVSGAQSARPSAEKIVRQVQSRPTKAWAPIKHVSVARRLLVRTSRLVPHATVVPGIHQTARASSRVEHGPVGKMQRPTASSPAPPAPVPAFNPRAYAANLRAPLQRRIHVNRAMRMLQVAGTSEIEFEVMPDGHLVLAKVCHSSGSLLVDNAALQAVKGYAFPRFPGRKPLTFILPIEIRPHGSGTRNH